MADVESLMQVLHADPETLPGAPTNKELVKNSQAIKDLDPGQISDEARRGLLGMWQRTTVFTDAIGKLPYHDVENIEASVRTKLAEDDVSEARLLDLELLYRHILNEKSARTYGPSWKRTVWVGYRQPAIERPERQDPNIWDIPEEIWDDTDKGATARRAAWVMANRPDVTLKELTQTMSLHDDEIAEAQKLAEVYSLEKAHYDYLQSSIDYPNRPTAHLKNITAVEAVELDFEYWGVDLELAVRIRERIADVLKIIPLVSKGELFITWHKPNNGSYEDEPELDIRWFPQKEAA